MVPLVHLSASLSADVIMLSLLSQSVCIDTMTPPCNVVSLSVGTGTDEQMNLHSSLYTSVPRSFPSDAHDISPFTCSVSGLDTSSVSD